eukprot:3966663-Ditylum_brightwellii.AAC.1
MMVASQQAQWCNVTNQQNGVALLVLDPKLEGYEVAELYQWEMCLQLTTHGALEETLVSAYEVANPLNSMDIK